MRFPEATKLFCNGNTVGQMTNLRREKDVLLGDMSGARIGHIQSAGSNDVYVFFSSITCGEIEWVARIATATWAASNNVVTLRLIGNSPIPWTEPYGANRNPSEGFTLTSDQLREWRVQDRSIKKSTTELVHHIGECMESRK